MNNKKRIVNLEYFREMLHICLRIPDQPFNELPFKEEILAFLRNLGHSGEIKKITDVNINKLHQPWRSFAAVINKCLSCKSTDVPKIYMQKFWATAIVHYHSSRFKMNNKKRIVNLEYFREMLHICLRIPDQPFNELPFKEEILAFLRNLGHSGEIKKITDVNINKLHQPWRSFAAVINKCLSCKSTGYDSLRLSQAQILWGMYHKKNVDFSYLLWEDFVYQVEHKDSKKSNEMYYPRFTKVIINFFMTKDPSIPRRNKVNWHYVRDDQMFKTIKLVSRHQNTQQFCAILPVELTNKDIRNSAAYKEYYAIALGAEPPKTKESVRKTQSSSDTTMPPLKSSDEDDDDDVQQSEHDEDINEQIEDESHDDQEDDDDQDEEDDDQDDSDNDASHGINVRGDEGPDADDDDNELYEDININLEGRDAQMTDVHTTQVLEDTNVSLTLVNPDGQQQSSSVSSQFVTIMFNPSPDTCIDSLFESTPRVDVPVTTIVEPLLLTAPTLPLPSILTISQLQQSDRLQDEAQAENEDFLNKLDENIQKIIKEQVKEQVKIQVSKILPKIKKTVNEQLKAEVLTRASNSLKTSYTVAADLSKLELKKILIEKIENNKSIHQSDEQQNLYKALVDAYECDKIILDTYGNTVTLKRHHDDEDKDEEPSARSERGSKRRLAGKKPESTGAPKEKISKTFGKSTEGSKSYQKTATKSSLEKEPMHTTLDEPSRQEFETCVANDQPVAESSQHPECDMAKQADSRTSFNELMDTPVNFSAFLMNRLKVDTLTPELLAGPTYELMKGSCKSLVELEFFLEKVYKETTDQLDWNNPEGQQYPHDLIKPLQLIPNSLGRRVIPFDHFINNYLQYLRGGASSRKDVESKAFFDSEIGQLSLNQKKQHVFNVLNVKPLEIAFFELIELVIIFTYSYPIQMLVVIPFDDLKFGDNDDSTFGVDISSRFPVDRITIKLLTFYPPMRDSSESIFIIVDWAHKDGGEGEIRISDVSWFRISDEHTQVNESRIGVNRIAGTEAEAVNALKKEALEITPIDQAHQFMSPPSGDAIMDFVNQLGYTEAHIPCSSDALGYNHDPTKKDRKDKPHVIPYFRFMKIIICEINEVIGMPILDELISNNIRNAPYYNAYLEMVAKHDLKLSAEKEGKKKTVSGKQPKSKHTVKKASKPAPAPKSKASKERPSKASTDKPPKPKPAKEKSTKTTLPQPTGKGKVIKVRKAKSQF
nr:hypothetical protein [Tanacetum cinerariifolium]